MRPKSAVNRRKLTNQKKSESTTKKKQPYNSSYSSVSRVQSRFTNMTHKWQIKTQKLKVCKDAKSIALIHAYQPKRLKQCIVSDPKSYQRFYNNFGQCELTNLYTKSFLKHFRQWRRNLRERITNVVSMLSQTKEQIKPEEVQMVLRQIQGITEQLKSATSAVMNARDAENSKGARELFENFEHMQDYIKKLAEIVRHLCQYIKYINKLLQEGADKTEQQSLREIQKKVKKLHKEYERKLVQPLQFCTSHPESTFMNRTEYKMKLKFDHIAKQAIRILEQIFKLTLILQNFQDKFQAYTNKKMRPQQYTVDILQQIATLISTYEQYKLKDKGTIPQQQNQITKSNEVILKLKTKINSQIRLFLDTFKEKSQQILKYELQQVKNQKVIDSIKNYANRFKICKKKILILTKIFNKYNYPSYYEVLTNSIKQTSQNFQNIGELIEQMTKVSNNKKIHNRVKVCRVIQSILPFVNKYEDNKSKIALSISKIIMDETQNQSERQATLSQCQPNNPLQSEKLMKFLQIMHFSQNQTQQLLSIPHYQVKQPTSMMTDEQIEAAVESNIQQIYRLSHDVFPSANRNSMQLSKLINDELINKFVAFSDDIMKESIHSFQIFQQFYQKIYGNEGHEDKKIHKKGIISMLDYFNETIEKFNGYKNQKSGKKFVEWMFENRMAMHVLNSMKKVNKILNDEINKQYWSLSEKIRKSNVCYRMNMEVKEYVREKKQLLEEIVRSSSKYVRQKSIFDYYFNQCLKKISDFGQNQKIYEEFDNSVETGEYWPTFNVLYQWDNQQFDYNLGESVPASALREKRKQIYRQLQDCLFKLNKLTQKQEKVQLGLKFMGQVERKKKDIKQILMPLCRVEPKNEQISERVKNYKQLSKSLTSYLIKNNINHTGLVAQNEDIILILNNNSVGNYDKILEGLEKRLKLDPFSLERNELNSRFMPMEISNIVKWVTEKYGNKKQSSAQFLLSQKSIEGKKNANLINNSEIKDQIQQQNNYDEVFDQQIEEQDQIQDGVDMVQSIIQQTPNLNKNKSKQKNNSTGLFVLQNKNNEKGQKGQGNPSFVLQDNQIKNKTEEQFYSIPDGYLECTYYKIKQLANLQTVSQCLRGGKIQSELINKNIQIPKLALAFEKHQPNKQLVDHLNQIISQTSKNNFMSVLNNKNKLTKNQQVLQNLKQALLSFPVQLISPQVLHELRAKKQRALTDAFNLIQSKYRYLYDEGDQGNRIILCEYANSQQYVHAVLNNQSPLAKEGQLVSDRNCVEIQKLYLNSLLKVPYEKNGNMEQIIGEIRKCNEQLGKKYKKLKDTLSVYKEQGCNIQNRKELDKKMEQYYEQKSKKQRKFSVPGVIDYDSYKIFLSQYEDIFSIPNRNSKLCKVLINGRIQLALFMSNNPQEVKNILSTIIPSIYNSFPFVERNSLEMINIKLADISKNILQNQLKDYRNLSSPQIFELLYGSGYGNSNSISPYNQQTEDQISRLMQKLDKLFQAGSNKASVKDFTDVANLAKIIGTQDYLQILNRLQQLQGQKQLLQKISAIRKSSAAFILKNNEEIQKEREYLQNVDDCASFILEREAQKVEIPSYMLQEVNDVLSKMKISHWVMRHKNTIIGLGDGNASAEMAMKKCLNIKQSKINWKQKSVSQNKWEKEIEIETLAIQLSISDRIKENIIKGKEEVAHQAIDNHFIEVNNENNIQTIVSIYKMNEQPVIVQCKYPRRSIEIKLKKKVNPSDNKSKSKALEIQVFITKRYNFGSKYNLIAFQNQIIKDILSQYDQLRIQEQRIREQERKRKQLEQQRKIQQEQERLKKIQLQQRKKQEEEIRKKILEDQIRNKIEQQFKLKKIKQEQDKQRQQQQERERIKEKEKEKEKENQKHDEQKRELQNKKACKKEKGKKIIIKNRDQKDAIQLFYNYSEDDKRQVPYEKNQKINKKKVNKEKKIEKYSTDSEQSDTSEMSIILSENNEIQRQELKKKNSIYRFTNVNELIKANKPMFILDE